MPWKAIFSFTSARLRPSSRIGAGAVMAGGVRWADKGKRTYVIAASPAPRLRSGDRRHAFFGADRQGSHAPADETITGAAVAEIVTCVTGVIETGARGAPPLNCTVWVIFTPGPD